MREQYDTGYGKFNSPMAAFIYERCLLHGDFGDSETSDDQGNWASRYGRRVLVGDDSGFVTLDQYDTVAEAEAAIVQWAEILEPADDE